MTKATLAERAQICRDIAAAHRRIAANTLAIAERLEADARAMDAGVDPFADRPLAKARPA